MGMEIRKAVRTFVVFEDKTGNFIDNFFADFVSFPN